MGHFKVSSKVRLAELNINDRLEESDFASITPTGEFVQLVYVDEEEKTRPVIVKPGIWTMRKTLEGISLVQTAFVSDRILDSFVQTKHIEEKIECFFSKLQVYYELGFEVPKRAALLYGVPGTGKTTIINKICNKYNEDGKTAIVVWATDAFDAFDVKNFIKSFSYSGVEKLILVAEDIGGIEIDEVRMKSDSSLLSLLDNQEKTFKIPVFILATTNFPQVFMGNLTNRPNRFDDKIEVGYPNAETRVELLKFFSKTEVSEECISLMLSNKCSKFSPAHIREVIIRHMIYDRDMKSVINEIVAEIENYEKGFSKMQRTGFMD